MIGPRSPLFQTVWGMRDRRPTHYWICHARNSRNLPLAVKRKGMMLGFPVSRSDTVRHLAFLSHVVGSSERGEDTAKHLATESSCQIFSCDGKGLVTLSLCQLHLLPLRRMKLQAYWRESCIQVDSTLQHEDRGSL